MNIDNLRDALFASDVVGKHGLTTTKKLNKWMIQQNDKLGQEYSKPLLALAGSVAEAALQKANKYKFLSWAGFELAI